MAIKPIYDLQWSTDSVTSGTSGNPNKLEPFEFKSEGQQEGLPVPRQYLNFQFDAIRQWKDYLEETTDALLSSSGAALLRTNNLADLTNVATARTNLGLTSVATNLYADASQAATGTSTTTVMSPARTTDHFNGRTTALTRAILGRTDAASVRADLGLGTGALSNVTTSFLDNTSGRLKKVNDALTFSSDNTPYDILLGPSNGPAIRARWSTLTNDRYIEYGYRDNNSIFRSDYKHSQDGVMYRTLLGSEYPVLDTSASLSLGPTVSAARSTLNIGTAANLDSSSVVQTTGDQTIGGTKTFSSTISANISGNSATVTNGVYTTGNQTINGTKTFTSPIAASVTGNSGSVTNGVYTVGNQSIGGTKTFTSQVLAPSFRVSSDPELKGNLIEHKPVADVDKIKLMQWVWKQHDNVPSDLQGKEDSGVDASVVKQIFPNCVGEDSNGFLVVDYAKLAVHLILAKGE